MLNRFAHAFLAFCLGQGIGILASLLLVPLYLHVWSPGVYGEWLALSSVVSYLSSLDLGIQSYAVNRLTQAYARSDTDDYRLIQHSAFALYFWIALLGTVGLAGFAYWAPICSWFNLIVTTRRSAFLVMVLLGGQLLWTLPGSLEFYVYRTTGDLARSQWIWNASRVLSIVLTALALFFWPKLPVLAAMQLGGFLLILAFVLWDVRRRFPGLMPGFSGAKFSMLRPILNQSLFFALIEFSIGAGLQGSNLIVVSVAGAAALALFVTTRTLANSIRQLVGLTVNAASTDLTRLEAADDKPRLRLAFRFVMFASVASCLAISSSLWFEGTSVFGVWTHGRLLPDTWLLRLFLIWLVLQSPWTAAAAIPLYTNRHKPLTLSYLFANIGGLALGAVLIPRMGLKGVPVAFIFTEAIACYHFVVREACDIVDEPYPRFARKLWVGLVFISSAALLTTWAVHRAPCLGTLPRWICSGAASIITVAITAGLFWFRTEDRIFVRQKAGIGLRFLGKVLPLRLRPTNT